MVPLVIGVVFAGWGRNNVGCAAIDAKINAAVFIKVDKPINVAIIFWCHVVAKGGNAAIISTVFISQEPE